MQQPLERFAVGALQLFGKTRDGHRTELASDLPKKSFCCRPKKLLWRNNGLIVVHLASSAYEQSFDGQPIDNGQDRRVSQITVALQEPHDLTDGQWFLVRPKNSHHSMFELTQELARNSSHKELLQIVVNTNYNL